jgi:transposase
VAKALEGDYREEHVFTLKQSLGSFRYYQRLIAEVDKEIASRLQALETSPEAEAAPPTRTKKGHYQRQQLWTNLVRSAGRTISHLRSRPH